MHHVHYRSAGGIVIHEGRVLLLERPSRGEVRLPKGHVEEGETPVEAALREVGEEAGYRDLSIVADLGVWRVEFFDPFRGRQVTRDERFFLMRLQGSQQIPREEQEAQFHPIWVPLQNAVARLTFQAEKEHLKRALVWIGEYGFPPTG